MITDINKLQQDIRAIGSVSDSADFFEGFLRAFNIPVSTIDRLKSTSAYDVNEGVRIGQQIFYLVSEGSNLYSDLNILKKNNISSLKDRRNPLFHQRRSLFSCRLLLSPYRSGEAHCRGECRC